MTLLPDDPKVQYLMRRARYAYWRQCTAQCLRLSKPWRHAVDLYENAIIRLLGWDDFLYPYHSEAAQCVIRLKLPAIPKAVEEVSTWVRIAS